MRGGWVGGGDGVEWNTKRRECVGNVWGRGCGGTGGGGGVRGCKDLGGWYVVKRVG